MPVAVGPWWTEKLFPPRGGQDHLGLGSVSSAHILESLSPGVIVQTVHPRYWSLYLFLLDEFWRRELPRTSAAFSAFFRPREAIFAIGAHLCDRPEHTASAPMQAIVGSDTAAPLARGGAPQFDAGYPYIGGRHGGYGLYYNGAIAGMGLAVLATRDPAVPWDLPTPAGRAIAAAFRRAIADTRYYRFYFDDDAAQVPRDVVLEYIRRACLCQLQLETAPDRPLLVDAFLHAGASLDAERRRATLRLVCDLVDKTDGHSVNQDRFRQLVFYRSDLDGATYTPSPGVSDVARRWRLYQTREYFSYAVMRTWRHLCQWGALTAMPGGGWVALDDLWEYLDGASAPRSLATAFDLEDPGLDGGATIDDLTRWIGDVANVDGGLDDPWPLASLCEQTLFRYAERHGGPEIVAGMIGLLALLASRLGSPSSYARDIDIVAAGGVARLSVDRFIRQWTQRRMRGVTVAEVARWLISDYVIRQHERVATGKLTDGDTFRFRRQGDRLRFFAGREAPARMTNSRFAALSTTAFELGLVESIAAPGHVLRSEGRQLLEDGDLPGRPLDDAVRTMSSESGPQL